MAGILSKNIQALRKFLRLNQQEFGIVVGSDQTNVSRWEGKGVVPGGVPLSKMAELAATSVDAFTSKPWLPPRKQSLPSDQPPIRSSDAGESVDIVQLDLSLSMGPGTAIEDFVESEIVSFDAALLRRITRTPSDRLRFVTGIGTSHEPKFQSGDQFLINMNERTLSRLDGYYWITFDGAHGLKRLRPLGSGRMQIISENPEYGPMDVDANAVRIEGRAIWFARGL